MTLGTKPSNRLNQMFSLLTFKIQHKGNILYDCRFTSDPLGKRNELLSTLIIGENGTGKSHLLSLIADFFRLLSDSALGKRTAYPVARYEDITMEYVVDGQLCYVERNKRVLVAKLDGVELPVVDLPKPRKVIAVSYMLNDKFSFSNDHGELYEYCGIRAASNASYTGSIRRQIFSSILAGVLRYNELGQLKRVLDFLKLQHRITFSIPLNRKTLFSRGLSVSAFHDKLKALERSRSAIARLPTDAKVTYEQLISALERLKSSVSVTNGNVIFELNFENVAATVLAQTVSDLDVLSLLELTAPPELSFHGADTFGFDNSSSGEKHILHTMINLGACVDQDSLILIDEPELSLHPKWQMLYVDLLKNVLAGFQSSHALLASHSHFMVSDLRPETSSLVTMSNNAPPKGGRACRLVDYDTYAWSAENILYEIFGLRTTRNYYFERDLRELLLLISKKREKETVELAKELFEKLQRYTFKEGDPLREVLAQAESYIWGNNDKKN